jgi:hypothetical protein
MTCALRIKAAYVYFIVGFAVLLALPASLNILSGFNFLFLASGPVLGGFYAGPNCSGPNLMAPSERRRVPIELPDDGFSACRFEAACAASSFNVSVNNATLSIAQFEGANCSAAPGGAPPLADAAPLPAARGCIAFPLSNRSAWVNPQYPLARSAAPVDDGGGDEWSTLRGAVGAAIPTSFYFAVLLLWLLRSTAELEDNFPVVLAGWQRAAAKRGAALLSLSWATSLLAVFLVGLAVTSVVPLRGGEGAFCSLEWPPVQLDAEWARVLFAVELSSVLTGLAAVQLYYLHRSGFCHGGTTTAVPVIALVALCRGPRNTLLRCATCRRPAGTYSPPHKLARLPGTTSLPATALLFSVIGATRTAHELRLFFGGSEAGVTAAPASFPEPTRALLYAGCALTFASALLLVCGFWDIRGLPAVGSREGAWLFPEPEEYLNPPPFALAVVLPPRALMLQHLGPGDTAARLESCLECWLASPRRACPRAAGAAALAPAAPGAPAELQGVDGGAAGAPPPRSPHCEPLQCAMCYESYEPGGGMAWLTLVCGHVFHHACIHKWASHQAAAGNHVHCPLDRVLVSVAAPRAGARGGGGRRDDGAPEGWMRGGAGGWRSTRGRVAAQPPAGSVVLSPVVVAPHGDGGAGP